jgi:hypothetical protein
MIPSPRSVFFSIPFLLLIAGGCAREPAFQQTRVLESYRFSFEVPSGYRIESETDDFAVIHRESDGEHVAEVSIQRRVPGDDAPETFRDHAVHRARMTCAADGPDENVSCTKPDAVQPFETQSGLPGITFNLEMERRRNVDNALIESSGHGPFYAIDLSGHQQNGESMLVLIHPPSHAGPAEIDAGVLRRVAESVQALEDAGDDGVRNGNRATGDALPGPAHE